MSQHDYDLANQSRTNFRQDLNNALQALAGLSSGASEPTTKYAYQLWADTTAGLLKIRNAGNNAWLIVGTLASAYLGLANLAADNDFTASQKLKGDALLLRFKDTGGSGVEWAIRSDGGNLELCENIGTEGSPTWTVRKVITSNGILNPYIASVGTNTYTATYSPAIAFLNDGMELEIEFINASTNVATLNVNGLGAKKLYKESSGAYTQAGSGDIFAGMRTSISFKSSLDTGSGGWILKNPKSGAGGFTGKFFNAYCATDQSIGQTSWTKIQMDTEDADADNVFDPTTNYRAVIPNGETWVLTVHTGINEVSANWAGFTAIYKNGSLYKQSAHTWWAENGNKASGMVSAIVTGNGTDYYEAYIYRFNVTKTLAGGGSMTYFYGYRVK